MNRKWKRSLLGFLYSLSLIVIVCTALLEYFSNLNMLFLTWGYLLGICLTVFSANKVYALMAFALSLVCIAFGLIGSDRSTVDLIESGLFTATGLCIATGFVLVVIHRNAKAENYKVKMTGIFSYSTQAIILTDQTGRIILVNSFTEHLFGYTNQELAGKEINVLVPEILLSSSVKAEDNTHSKTLKPLIIEHQDRLALRKDESMFPVEISMNHYFSEGDLYRIAFMSDITLRKKNNDVLEAQKKELETVNKELEAFSYSVSHDLRSPLRAVGGYAQMLEEDYTDVLDKDGKRLLHNIGESAQRMGSLIDDLLAFSRLGRKEVQKRRVNMTRLVEVSLSEINLSVKHHAEIVVGELHTVMADPSLISRVIVNLLANAVKYSAKCEYPRVEINSVTDDDSVIFSIRDNGVGFNMKYVHKLFGVFQRLHTDTEFEGTGVGLAIANRIVSKHGGKIWAEGEEGVGACFYFSLPLCEEQITAIPMAMVEHQL